MACRRSAVRSRLAPPDFPSTSFRAQAAWKPDISFTASPSSRGLGHYPFTVATGVRIPVGTPIHAGARATGPLFFVAVGIGMAAGPIRGRRRLLRLGLFFFAPATRRLLSTRVWRDVGRRSGWPRRASLPGVRSPHAMTAARCAPASRQARCGTGLAPRHSSEGPSRFRQVRFFLQRPAPSSDCAAAAAGGCCHHGRSGRKAA